MNTRQGPLGLTHRVVSRAFVLLWIYSALTSLAWAALLLALPLYVTGPLGGGNVAVGLVMTAATLISAGLQPAIGALGDRRGRRLLLVGGPIWFATCVGAFSLVQSPEALFIARAAAGIGDAAFMVGALTLVSDLAPAGRQGEAYSLFSLSTWVGMGLGPVCAGLVVHAFSFDAVWLMCGLLAVVGAGLGALLPDSSRAPRTQATSGIRFSRGVLAPGAVLALEMFGFVTLFVFGPLYARELGMANGGVVLLVASAVLVLIRVFGRTIPDRLGAYGGATAGLVCVVIGLTGAAALDHPVGLFIGGAGVGVGHALAYPALFMLALSRTPPGDRSAALGTFKACESFGFAAAAAGLGVVAEAGGYGLVFVVGGGATLLGAFVLRAGPREQVHAP